MKKRAFLGVSRVFMVLIIAILVASCSKFRKVQKSEDWEVKYKAALEYYEDEDYYRASILFEEIMPFIRGLKEGEMAQFYYAYCIYHQRQYQLASYYFKTFYETYARSTLAIEAQYMHAYSLYNDSPLFNLDQTSTKEAIAAMQFFMNRNPSSEYFSDASSIIEELQDKLETKAYENARLYHRMRLFKSAIIAIKNFGIDYPDSEYNEELQYLRFMAQYQLAQQSVVSLQEERYREAIDFYLEFAEKYPQSAYLEEAGRLYDDSITALGKIKRDQNL